MESMLSIKNYCKPFFNNKKHFLSALCIKQCLIVWPCVNADLYWCKCYLGCYANWTGVEVTLSHHGTAQCNEGGGGEPILIGS